MWFACACKGLINTARSSGTITEGTNRIGERRDFNQSDPSLTLA
jgi:hypothetical protein